MLYSDHFLFPFSDLPSLLLPCLPKIYSGCVHKNQSVLTYHLEDRFWSITVLEYIDSRKRIEHLSTTEMMTTHESRGIHRSASQETGCRSNLPRSWDRAINAARLITADSGGRYMRSIVTNRLHNLGRFDSAHLLFSHYQDNNHGDATDRLPSGSSCSCSW